MGAEELENIVDIEDFIGDSMAARYTQIAILGAVYGSDKVRRAALACLGQKYGDSIAKVYRMATE